MWWIVCHDGENRRMTSLNTSLSPTLSAGPSCTLVISAGLAVTSISPLSSSSLYLSMIFCTSSYIVWDNLLMSLSHEHVIPVYLLINVPHLFSKCSRVFVPGVFVRWCYWLWSCSLSCCKQTPLLPSSLYWNISILYYILTFATLLFLNFDKYTYIFTYKLGSIMIVKLQPY